MFVFVDGKIATLTEKEKRRPVVGHHDEKFWIRTKKHIAITWQTMRPLKRACTLGPSTHAIILCGVVNGKC